MIDNEYKQYKCTYMYVSKCVHICKIGHEM